MIIFLLVAASVVAQEDYVVFEGGSSSYNVDFRPGNSYQWEVLKQFSPTVYATSDDFEFIRRDTTNEVEIRWKSEGQFYVLLNEFDESGCTNTKALVVSVQGNNSSIGFEYLSSTSCFSDTGNSFDLPLEILNHSGQPLGNEYFPINVEFSVNGDVHAQQLNFNNQVISISSEWFDQISGSDTEIEVEIMEVKDNSGVPIDIRSAEKTSIHTIFSNPEISFAGNIPDTVFLNASLSIEAEFKQGYIYDWWYMDSDGTQYDFNSKIYATEDYLWKSAGTFEIFLQVTDENNCSSEVISKTLVVSDEIRIPQLVALPDFTMGHANTTIIGDVAANDFLFPNRSWNLIYTLVDDPFPGLIFNPDGSFIYIPEEDFSGEINFTYQVCFEDPTFGCATSESVVSVISNLRNENIAPVAITDNVLTFPNQMVTGNLLLNDIDPDGDSDQLSITLNPVIDPLNGKVEIAEDGSFSYTPNNDFEGPDKFMYQICDSGTPTLCDSGWVYVVVNDFDSGSSKPISTSDDIFISNEDTVIFAGNDTIIGNCESYILGGNPLEGEGYSYSWEPIENLDDPSSPNPVFTPGTSTLYYFTVTNSNGFYAIDSVLVTVIDVNVEAGENVFMYTNSSIILDGSYSTGLGLRYNWTTDNGFIESGENSANPVVTEIGTYYLQVTDTFGCQSIDSVHVGILTYAPVAQDDYDSTTYRTEIKIPVLNNDSDQDDDIDSLSLVISSAPFNGSAYVDYDDFTIHYTPDEDFSESDYFEYRICDFSENCDEAKVTVWVSDIQFFIPDAFSPNGDNINDYFEIPGIEYYEGNSIEIFNRWGNKVYEARNYGISTVPKYWNGKSNTGFRLGSEDLPTGTYFYIINLGKGEERIAGSVYLDR